MYSGRLSYLSWNANSSEQSGTQTSDNLDSQRQPRKAKEEDADPPTKKRVSITVEIEEDSKKEEPVADAMATTPEQTGTQTVDTSHSPAPTTLTETKSEIPASEQCTGSELSNHDSSQQAPREISKQFGPKADLLSPLSEPVPDNWETLEREFMGVTPLMIPHMAHNFFGDPEISIGEGKIRIVICDGNIKRLDMLGMLTKADTGGHIEIDGVLRRDVRAFRLEPFTSPGMLTIDGEEVYYGPIQCHD